MSTFKRQLFGYAIILPFIISIMSWFQGWEIFYRPISDAPALSPFTSLIFILLFFNKINIKEVRISSFSTTNSRLYFIGTIVSILFFELVIHTGHGTEFLGFPISAVSTILTFFFICILEITSNESKDCNLLVDTLILLALFWVYLSICGHIFGELSLTGINTDRRVGLSLPTAISFLVYLGILIKNDQISFTKKFFQSVIWTKKYMYAYLLGYITLPFLFIMILKSAVIQPEDQFKIFLLFSLIGLQFIALFIALIHFLSRTHTGHHSICSLTKRIKNSKGEWVPIESYLHKNYGLDLKYVSSVKEKL